MPMCLVNGCTSQTGKKNTDTDVMLHCFPKNPERVKIWLQQTRQRFKDIDKVAVAICDDKRHNNYRLCSRHFSADSYTIKGTHKSLNKYAIPTIFPTGTGVPCIDEYMFFKPCKRLCMEMPTSSPTTIKDLLHFTKILCDVSTSTSDLALTREAGTQTDSISLEGAIELAQSSQLESCSLSKRMSVEHRYARPLRNTRLSKKLKGVTRTTSGEPALLKEAPEEPFEESFSLSNIFDEEAKTSPQPKAPYWKTFLRSDGLPKILNSKQQWYCSLDSAHPDTVKSVEKRMVSERKFIVFESNVDALCYKVSCQGGLNCTGRIIALRKRTEGSYLRVSATCEKGHRFSLWESQPKISNIGAGNILLAASILFSGSTFLKVQEMLDILGLQQISKTAYCRYQHRYLYGSISHHWRLEQERVRDVCRDRPLCLAGNGQCQGPVANPDNCLYTFMDVASKKIVDFVVLEISPMIPSVLMVEKGFQICLNRILVEHLDVQIIATDRHGGIKKLVKEQYKDIDHQYEGWNFANTLKNDLIALSKRKYCSDISSWIEAIVDHFWWSIKTCNGNKAEFRERWHSVIYHVSNQHEWVGGERYHACSHPAISEEENLKTKWIPKESPAFENLLCFVDDAKLNVDLEHLAQFCNVGALESFQRLALKYRPKRERFGIYSMEARTALAILAHNHNMEKKHNIVKTCLEEAEDFCPKRTKLWIPSRKRWITRIGNETMSNEHLEDLLLTVLSMCSGNLT